MFDEYEEKNNNIQNKKFVTKAFIKSAVLASVALAVGLSANYLMQLYPLPKQNNINTISFSTIEQDSPQLEM